MIQLVVNAGENYGNGFVEFGSAVPEPSTWAMLLLGFAGIAFVGYRRSRQKGRSPAVSPFT